MGFEPTKGKTSWNVRRSAKATNTDNPVRRIAEGLVVIPNPEKAMIDLSLGDPTKFGNMKPAIEAVVAVTEALQSGRYNGYSPTVGLTATREAVAKYTSRPSAPLKAEDVIMTGGTTHALDLCISVLCSRGANLLVPCPGFSMYQTVARSLDIEPRFYQLKPGSNWEVDIDSLIALADTDTAAIIVNNPSNPCGAVYSRQHLLDILSAAELLKVPIISDEVYADMVFAGHTFYPLASLTTTVPILTCSGLSKKFICPGWRLAWITIHDRNGILGEEIRQGLTNLTYRILHPNVFLQAALPAILSTVPQAYFDNIMQTIQKNVEVAFEHLKTVPGLTPIMPAGSMYMMVGINLEAFLSFAGDELQFISSLVREESVFCLPGQCFAYPGYFRIVLCLPIELTKEAVTRIGQFCQRHHTVNNEDAEVRNGWDKK